MSKKLIPIIALVVVAVIVVLLVGKKSPKEEMMPETDTTMTETDAPVTTTPKKKVTIVKTTEAPTAPVVTTTEDESMEDVEVDNVETSEPTTVDVRIFVNDEKANLSSFEVNKGDTVRLTLTADPRNNYHGGLEFTSGVVDPIRILNGQSVMVTFVAEASFAFTPHWPGYSESLPYKINVIVK